MREGETVRWAVRQTKKSPQYLAGRSAGSDVKKDIPDRQDAFIRRVARIPPRLAEACSRQVFQAHRRLYHPTLVSGVIKKRRSSRQVQYVSLWTPAPNLYINFI